MSAPRALCILGASAGVGLQCVRRALDRGHRVTAVARGVATLPVHPNLRVIQGSATDPGVLREALAGCDAALVTLGTGKSIRATTLYSDFARALLAARDAMPSHAPLVVLTGFGAGDSAPYHGAVVGWLFRLFLGRVYADKTAMEDAIMRSGLNWILVRPGVLTDADQPEPVRAVTDYSRDMRIRFISRAAVARFMIEQAEQPTMIGRKPALTAA